MSVRALNLTLSSLAHELANAVRTSELPSEIAQGVEIQLEILIAQLDPFRHAGPFACEQLRPPGDGFYFDKNDPGGAIPYAPITGPLSPFSAEGELGIVEGTVSGELLFSPVHAGPMGLVHGGMLAAAFDEVMALATLAAGLVGYTRQMKVDYLLPVKLDGPVRFEAIVTVAEGRDIEVRSNAQQADQTVARAHARFRKITDLDEDFYASTGRPRIS